jgi:hypothetical protein
MEEVSRSSLMDIGTSKKVTSHSQEEVFKSKIKEIVRKKIKKLCQPMTLKSNSLSRLHPKTQLCSLSITQVKVVTIEISTSKMDKFTHTCGQEKEQNSQRLILLMENGIASHSDAKMEPNAFQPLTVRKAMMAQLITATLIGHLESSLVAPN